MTKPKAAAERADIVELLPEGWTAEDDPRGLLIAAPHKAGWVTVNFDRRNFHLGIYTVRERGAFKGRGWQQALVKAAIEQLRTVLL